MAKIPVLFPTETIFGGEILFVVPGPPSISTAPLVGIPPTVSVTATTLSLTPLPYVAFANTVKSMSNDPEGKAPGPIAMTHARASVSETPRKNTQQIMAIHPFNCAFIIPPRRGENSGRVQPLRYILVNAA